MKKIIQTYKPLIEQHIEILSETTIQSTVPWAHTIATAIADSAKKGKTVRGSILLATYSLFKENIPEEIIGIATILEYLHTSLLIHDDVIDHDELRRGNPSMHKVFEQLGNEKKYSNPPDFGKAAAICAGDIAIFGGFSYLSRISLPAEKKEQITTLLTREFLLVGFGEFQDVHFGYSPEIPSLDEILLMYKLKTARYTFSLPMMMGAILADQTDKTIKTFEKLGESLGIIYQLTDDLLTLKGNTIEVGKSVGNDISENKKTYYYVLLMQKADKKDKTIISSIIGKKDITQSDIQTIISLVTKYHVLESIEETITDLKKESIFSIESLPINQQQKEVLLSIPQYLIERTS